MQSLIASSANKLLNKCDECNSTELFFPNIYYRKSTEGICSQTLFAVLSLRLFWNWGNHYQDGGRGIFFFFQRGRHLDGGRCQRNGKWKTKPFRFLLLSYYYYLTFKRGFIFLSLDKAKMVIFLFFGWPNFCSWVAVAHFWWKEKFFLRNNRTNQFPRRIFQFGTPFRSSHSSVSLKNWLFSLPSLAQK